MLFAAVPQMDLHYLAADNVQSIVMPDTGHWLAEERPEQTLMALTTFL